MSDFASQKQGVALSSVAASALMALGKLVVGLATGSLGILSEAAHSLLDLGAATLTYFAVRLADQPADSRHPYGHAKIESVSALIETGLLLLTSLWIIREAVLRLLSDSVEVETTWYSVAVIVVSILIDFSRSRALMKVAKATKSQALEADALHFSSDILSSCVVLFGLGAVAAGFPKGDAVAALGVAVFVFRVGYDLGKRTIDVLVDTAPDGIAEQVETLAAQVPGVVRVEQVRARPAGATVFVEVLLRVSRTLALDDAEAVCDKVRLAIQAAVPEVNAFIKAEPLALDTESIIDTVRLTASRLALMAHDVAVHQVDGHRHVSFDIEVDEAMNIKDAHDIATRMENALRGELGHDVIVETHIDPRRFGIVQGKPLEPARLTELQERIAAIARGVAGVHDVHRIMIQQGDGALAVSLHCSFPPTAPVRVVHDAAVAIEQRIRQQVGAQRVVVHAEPLDHVDQE